MNLLIKESGGILVRVFEAINGFKSKHGFWPSEIVINSETLDVLKNVCFTKDGFQKFSGFLKITPTQEVVIITNGPNNSSFDYGSEGWQYSRPEMTVEELLGMIA